MRLTQKELQSLAYDIPRIESLYDSVKGLDKGSFMIVLVMLIDRWAGSRGMTSKETCEMLEILSQAQKSTHSALGPLREVYA